MLQVLRKNVFKKLENMENKQFCVGVLQSKPAQYLTFTICALLILFILQRIYFKYRNCGKCDLPAGEGAKKESAFEQVFSKYMGHG